MKKSRDIIKNTLILIILLILSICLLESNCFSRVRTLVSSIIPFFQGKSNFFSNVLIGILGSAIILAFGEILNYFQEKQLLQFKILELYQKWENELKLKSEKISTDFDFINYITVEMKDFAHEVDSIYNSYLPYFRTGIYFKLIRGLYQLTNTICEYINQIEHTKNERTYLLYCIEHYELLKNKSLELETRNEIEKALSLFNQQLAMLDKNKIDKEAASKEIHKKHLKVLNLYTNAELYTIYYKMNNLDKKDTKSEFENNYYNYKRIMRKIKIQHFFNKLKSLTPKARKEQQELERLLKKYSE